MENYETTLGELGAKRCTVGILSVKRGPLVCLVYRPYFVVDENTLRSREQIIDCFDTEQQLNEACATTPASTGRSSDMTEIDPIVFLVCIILSMFGTYYIALLVATRILYKTWRLVPETRLRGAFVFAWVRAWTERGDRGNSDTPPAGDDRKAWREDRDKQFQRDWECYKDISGVTDMPPPQAMWGPGRTEEDE